MKACHLICCCCFALILVPWYTYGQNDAQPAAYTFNDQGNAISSNVPLNEINTHALRKFHRLFPKFEGAEYWYSSKDGYQVSFKFNGIYYQSIFDPRGCYLYTLHHYAGKMIPREPGDMIRRRFPDYQLNVVTEITDGEKIVYMVRLVSPTRLQTISLCEGEIRVLSDEPISDPTETAEITSRPSYH